MALAVVLVSALAAQFNLTVTHPGTGKPIRPVSFVARYDRKAGIGTIVATMIPYSLTFLVVWTILLILRIVLGLPLGPGAGLYLQQ